MFQKDAVCRWNRYLLLNVQRSMGQLSRLPLEFHRPWMLVAFDSDFNVMKMFVDDLQLCVRRSSKIKSETCRSIDYFLIIIQNTEISRPWKIVVRAAFWLAHLLTKSPDHLESCRKTVVRSYDGSTFYKSFNQWQKSWLCVVGTIEIGLMSRFWRTVVRWYNGALEDALGFRFKLTAAARIKTKNLKMQRWM